MQVSQKEELGVGDIIVLENTKEKTRKRGIDIKIGKLRKGDAIAINIRQKRQQINREAFQNKAIVRLEQGCT